MKISFYVQIEDKIFLLSSKEKLLVAIETKKTQRKAEKNEQSVQKLKDSPRQKEIIKNVTSSKEEKNENTM